MKDWHKEAGFSTENASARLVTDCRWEKETEAMSGSAFAKACPGLKTTAPRCPFFITTTPATRLLQPRCQRRPSVVTIGRLYRKIRVWYACQANPSRPRGPTDSASGDSSQSCSSCFCMRNASRSPFSSFCKSISSSASLPISSIRPHSKARRASRLAPRFARSSWKRSPSNCCSAPRPASRATRTPRNRRSRTRPRG